LDRRNPVLGELSHVIAANLDNNSRKNWSYRRGPEEEVPPVSSQDNQPNLTERIRTNEHVIVEKTNLHFTAFPSKHYAAH
jgi:hypothetical protein